MDFASSANCLPPSGAVTLAKPTCSFTRVSSSAISPAPFGGGGGSAPTLSANGDLRIYGRNGNFRGTRCRGCEHASTCQFRLDIAGDPWLTALYEAPSQHDGHVRDACVFSSDIDIFDTMSALIRYQNGVQVSYLLNAAMPIEGYTLAFNGTGGRIETRQFDKQPWAEPPADEIVLIGNFKSAERIWVKRGEGGHFGGDDRMRNLLLRDGLADPLEQRAGVLSLVTGVAATTSARASGRPVDVPALLAEAAPAPGV